MTISILLMKQIAQLFLMIFMGYLIVKTGIVEDTDSKVLSKIIHLSGHPLCNYKRFSG